MTKLSNAYFRLTVIPLLHDRLPYDPERDLVPISAAARVSMGIAVANDVSVHSLSELIEFVRRRPDRSRGDSHEWRTRTDPSRARGNRWRRRGVRRGGPTAH